MLHTKKSVVAAKIETTVGTAESLAAADCDYIVYGFRMNPDIAFTERPGQGAFGRHKGVPGARGGSCTFSLDLTPGATTTAPQWALAFLPACGWTASGTSVPQTDPPGTGNVKTITIAHYQMGRKKVLAGCMGTFRITAAAGQRVMIEFTFTGVWVAPADVATPSSIDYPADSPVRFAKASALSFHSKTSLKVQQVTIDAGNVVKLREDANTTAGYISAVIEDRAVTGTINPEAELVATDAWHSIWVAGTEGALAIALSDGTNNLAIAAPKCQLTNVQESDRNGLFVEDITFAANRDADAGDDELTFTWT